MKIPQETTVLLVEDDSALLAAMASGFTRKGYKVLTAAGGTEAFQILETVAVDAVISDFHMPQGDGIELLKRVRTNPNLRPVIILVTGHTDLSIEEAYSNGAQAVFAKPLDIEALVQTMTRMLQNVEQRYYRSTARWDTQLPLGLKSQNGVAFTEARVLNIGRGGMFVTMQGKFPKVSDKIEFNLIVPQEPDKSIVGTGIVRWVREEASAEKTSGVGIEFAELSNESLQLLFQLILLDVVKTDSFIPDK